MIDFIDRGQFEDIRSLEEFVKEDLKIVLTLTVGGGKHYNP